MGGEPNKDWASGASRSVLDEPVRGRDFVMLFFETRRPIARRSCGCGCRRGDRELRETPPTGFVTVFPPACEVLPARSPRPTRLRLRSSRRLPEFAPWGHNAAEETVFRHVYETLITLDCVGRAGGGLASSWKSEDDGYRWVFGLRDGAHFSDGSMVTAATSWKAGPTPSCSIRGSIPPKRAATGR